MPDITVIIPVYNREKLIRYSIESVLKQTIDDFELLIVDDASTDHTVQEVLNICDRRVKLIKLQHNSGACAARNIGIKNATGKYIAFHDSDDIWEKNKLEICLEQLCRNKADVVFSGFEREYRNKKREILPKYNLNCVVDKVEAVLLENPVTTPTIFGRTEVFRDEMFDERMPRFQDQELAIRILKKYQLYYINQVLVHSYIQENSITMNWKKAVVGLRRLHEKNKMYYERDKVLEGNYYKQLAEFQARAGENCTESFEHAYQLCKNNNVRIKLLLSKLKIYKHVINIRRIILKKL